MQIEISKHRFFRLGHWRAHVKAILGILRLRLLIVYQQNLAKYSGNENIGGESDAQYKYNLIDVSQSKEPIVGFLLFTRVALTLTASVSTLLVLETRLILYARSTYLIVEEGASNLWGGEWKELTMKNVSIESRSSVTILGTFLYFLVTNFVRKVAQMSHLFVGYLEKHHFLIKTVVTTFWATLYFNI